MKKLFLVILFFSIYVSTLKAQDEKKDWDLSAGPTVAVPIKYLHLFHSFGLGPDIALLKQINDKWGAGVRANYLYFFGKSTEEMYGNTGSHYDAAHVFALLAEANYVLAYRWLLAVNLGLGVNVISGNTDVTLARMAALQYKLNLAKAITLALVFNQTNFQKYFALKANFSLHK